MPTQITITTELTRQGLQTVRDEIDALLAGGATVTTALPSTSPVAQTPSARLDGLAVDLKTHLNSHLQRLTSFLVDNYVGTEFIWDDVALAMKRDLGSVKSWHRSLSKPLNRIAKANPSAPRLLTSSWDGSRNHYTLSPDWAEAIKRTW